MELLLNYKPHYKQFTKKKGKFIKYEKYCGMAAEHRFNKVVFYKETARFMKLRAKLYPLLRMPKTFRTSFYNYSRFMENNQAIIPRTKLLLTETFNNLLKGLLDRHYISIFYKKPIKKPLRTYLPYLEREIFIKKDKEKDPDVDYHPLEMAYKELSIMPRKYEGNTATNIRRRFLRLDRLRHHTYAIIRLSSSKKSIFGSIGSKHKGLLKTMLNFATGHDRYRAKKDGRRRISVAKLMIREMTRIIKFTKPFMLRFFGKSTGPVDAFAKRATKYSGKVFIRGTSNKTKKYNGCKKKKEIKKKKLRRKIYDSNA